MLTLDEVAECAIVVAKKLVGIVMGNEVPCCEGEPYKKKV